MVAPGSTHSIRIGNVTEGGHFSRIHTEYTVTADNTLFQYKFAVILQNTGVDGRANHEPFQKPGFDILIFDSNGEELPCSSYDILHRLPRSLGIAGTIDIVLVGSVGLR